MAEQLKDWDTFLAEATAVFVAKNTDYESRFMRALLHYQGRRGYEAARTIWAWEVEKKLDRCRTWIKRGELLVKDEGVRNSAIDLFNYTVQYRIFRTSGNVSPLKLLSEKDFLEQANKNSPKAWIEYIHKTEGLIITAEYKLRDLLLEEMTGTPF